MTHSGLSSADSSASSSTTANSKPLIIVDGSSYLFRAYHALPPLTTSNGQPTGAIKGVMSMLQKLVDEYQPAYMCVVFDTKGTNFRHELFPEYKANRGAAPDELISQIEPLHELVKAMGFPLMALPGIEADDVIATIAQQAQDNFHVVISSGDKDLAQLVNDKIHLVNTMKQGEYLDPAGVEEKFGVKPEQIIDYLSLIGDKVDNIPGIDKVGPKTAVKWLLEYNSIEGLLENKDKIKGKVGDNLREQADRLNMAIQLVTLKTDVELPNDLESLKLQAADTDKLAELFATFEFKNELKKLQSATSGKTSEVTAEDIIDASPSASSSKAQYLTLTTEKAVQDWIAGAAKAEWLAFDTETNGLDVHCSDLVGVSMAYSDDEAVYIPCAHISLETGEAPEQVSREFLIEAIKPILEASQPLKIGQNIKFDMNLLRQYGIQMQGIGADTMLESYVLNATAGRHDMDSLATRYLGRSTISFTDIAGKGAKQKTFDQIELDIASDYAAEDAEITWLLHKEINAGLEKQTELKSLYDTIELPLMQVLADMEYQGALIDPHELAEQTKILNERICNLEKQAFDLVGESFNLASPKQIGVILYEKMGIPVIKKTPKGAPSTAEGVLQELALTYDLPRILLEHRSLSKLKSTYTDKLPELINEKTGRIHTSYHQAVTATGRLSSSDPNLQNIPIKTEEGRLIRKAFIAEKGFKLVAADYSQVELRLMAHFSEDEKLCQAFANNEDIHSATASEVFGVPLEDVGSDERRAAKAINFGLIYGMSAFGLSNQLGITRGEAQEYIDRYFARYPGVLEYMDSTKEKAKDKGYVETLFGRRLYLPDLKSKNHAIRQGAERVAINAPLQGTAADIMKIAMINLHQWLKDEALKTRMIMQVHDEVVLEVAEDEMDRVIENTNRILSEACSLKVPLDVSVGHGDNWLEAH
ncbi:MAG: DNA polymerase I [Pseudomonadota bacterium]|nr:DNA polymerase I [Pseudomonadota bacterium]